MCINPSHALQNMASSPILQDSPAKKNSRDWLDLPRDLMVSILQRICCYDILTNVKEVCKSWRSLCKDPLTWQVVTIPCDLVLYKLTEDKGMPSSHDEQKVKILRKMIMHVIDLSCGQMLDFCILGFGSDHHLLEYVCQRSGQLRRLRQHDYELHISTQRLTQILRHVPFLEELKLSNIPDFSPEHVEIIARRCPRLASLAINNLRAYEICCQPVCNQLASAIAKYMPQLCCLQLCGNRMTNAGLSAILHNCQHLEYLDIRQCYNIFVVLDPNLMTKVRKQIKHVRFSKISYIFERIQQI